ncbi:hypothetical protein RUND412_001156 [Rhizina undulata]
MTETEYYENSSPSEADMPTPPGSDQETSESGARPSETNPGNMPSSIEKPPAAQGKRSAALVQKPPDSSSSLRQPQMTYSAVASKFDLKGRENETKDPQPGKPIMRNNPTNTSPSCRLDLPLTASKASTRSNPSTLPLGQLAPDSRNRDGDAKHQDSNEGDLNYGPTNSRKIYHGTQSDYWTLNGELKPQKPTTENIPSERTVARPHPAYEGVNVPISRCEELSKPNSMTNCEREEDDSSTANVNARSGERHRQKGQQKEPNPAEQEGGRIDDEDKTESFSSKNESGTWALPSFISSPFKSAPRSDEALKLKSENTSLKKELQKLKTHIQGKEGHWKRVQEEGEKEIRYLRSEIVNRDHRSREKLERTENNYKEQMAELRRKHELELSELKALHFRAIREADGGVEPINDDIIAKRFTTLRDQLADWARTSFKSLNSGPRFPDFETALPSLCEIKHVRPGQLDYKDIVQAWTWFLLEGHVFSQWLFGVNFTEDILGTIPNILLNSDPGRRKFNEWRVYTIARLLGSPQLGEWRNIQIDNLASAIDYQILIIAAPRETRVSNEARLESLRSIVSTAVDLATDLSTQKAEFCIDHEIGPNMKYDPRTMKEVSCMEEPDELLARGATVSCILSKGWTKYVADPEGVESLRICPAQVRCCEEEDDAMS